MPFTNSFIQLRNPYNTPALQIADLGLCVSSATTHSTNKRRVETEGQPTFPDPMDFSADGTKAIFNTLWYTDQSFTDLIETWTLSTPWDLTTLTWTGNRTTPPGPVRSFRFADNGNRLILGSGNAAGGSPRPSQPYKIFMFDLTTPYELPLTLPSPTSTLTINGLYSHANVGLSEISTDGTKLYTANNHLSNQPSMIHMHTLTTPWDVSTAVYEASFDVQFTLDSGHFSPDGQQFIYLSGIRVLHRDLGTPWDITTFQPYTRQDLPIHPAAGSLLYDSPRSTIVNWTDARIFTASGDASGGNGEFDIIEILTDCATDVVYKPTVINPGAEQDVSVGWTNEVGGLGRRTTNPHSGTYIFDGGTSPTTRARQRFDLVNTLRISTTALDAGTVVATVYWWQNSFATQSDSATMGIRSLDAGQSTITTTYQPHTHPDSWVLREHSLVLASGTRYIDILMEMNRVAGTDNNGYIDDISLEIKVP